MRGIKKYTIFGIPFLGLVAIVSLALADVITGFAPLTIDYPDGTQVQVGEADGDGYSTITVTLPDGTVEDDSKKADGKSRKASLRGSNGDEICFVIVSIEQTEAGDRVRVDDSNCRKKCNMADDQDPGDITVEWSEVFNANQATGRFE